MTVQLGIGTAALGQPYAGLPRPYDDDALAALSRALELGIRFFDTAPIYGASAKLLSCALADWDGDDPRVTTKCSPLRGGFLYESRQLLGLQQDVGMFYQVDLLLHNPTILQLEALTYRSAPYLLFRAGKVRSLGASVYEPEEALAALRHPLLSAIQVPYSLLDQRFDLVLREAKQQGKRTIVRSVLLRGRLAGQVERAIRFAVSHPAVDVVLVGVRSVAEVEAAVSAFAQGPLRPEELADAYGEAISDREQTDPRRWDA